MLTNYRLIKAKIVTILAAETNIVAITGVVTIRETGVFIHIKKKRPAKQSL
jgi:hypothetical protein